MHPISRRMPLSFIPLLLVMVALIWAAQATGEGEKPPPTPDPEDVSPTPTPVDEEEVEYHLIPPDYPNPERGMAPTCIYKGLGYQGEVPYPIVDGDCCFVDQTKDPQTEAGYREQLARSIASCADPNGLGLQDYTLIFLSVFLDDFKTEDVGSVSPRFIGKPMESLNGAFPESGPDPVLKPQFLAWMSYLQYIFDEAGNNGMKLVPVFHYGDQDIDAEHVLGSTEYGIKGHLESIRDWLFNPGCYDPAAPECSQTSETSSLNYFKRELSHLVAYFIAGFVGKANGEWGTSDWPESWGCDKDCSTTYGEENRQKVLNFLLDMLTLTLPDGTLLMRPVYIRNTFIKNDYFDEDRNLQLNLASEEEYEVEVTPVDAEDLKACPTTRAGSGSEDEGPLCAKQRLGYFNAAMMQSNNEGVTYALYNREDPDDRETNADEEAHRKFLLEDLRYLPMVGEAPDSVFTSFGGNCTEALLAYEQAPESIDLEAVCRDDENFWMEKESWRSSYDVDGDCIDSNGDGIDDDEVCTREYACVDSRYFLKSDSTYLKRRRHTIDAAGVYRAYRKTDGEPKKPGGSCVAVGGTGCISDADCGVNSSTGDNITCAEGVCQMCETRLICHSGEGYDDPQDSDATPDAPICIPKAHCLLNDIGTHKWFQQRHWSGIKGTKQSNYWKFPILRFMEDQIWWPTVVPRLGYRIFIKPTWNGSNIELKVLNRGYAAPYSRRPVYLVLDPVEVGSELQTPCLLDPQAPDPVERCILVDTELDVRLWGPSCPVTNLNRSGVCSADEVVYLESVTLPEGLFGCYRAGLWMPDQDPRLQYDARYAIRAASTDGWHWSDGVNWLKDPEDDYVCVP